MSVEQPAVVQNQVEGSLAGPRVQWGRVALSAAVFLAVWLVAARFYKQTYLGITDRAAIDAAQVAKNISHGEGFTTHFVRPFNAALDRTEAGKMPELNAGPIYPYILSWAIRMRTPSDQVVVWISLLFYALAVAATYALGRLLFDRRAGLVAAAVLGLSVSTLRAGVSGSNQAFLVFTVTLLLIALALHHRSAFERKKRASTAFAAVAAVLTAALYMTDYIYAFAALPVVVYFAVTGPFKRLNLVVYLLATALLMSPCAYRNLTHTGFPVLGIRAWDIMAHTATFPGDTLFRSTDLANDGFMKPVLFPAEQFVAFAEKVVRGSENAVNAIIPMLGFAGMAFAVVSMLYRFKMPTANAVRGLLYGLVPIMILVFAAYGEQPASVVIFAPAAAVFASAYALLLVDAKKLHPFFASTLVGFFIALTGAQCLGILFWGAGVTEPWNNDRATNTYFADLGTKGLHTLIYTDVPWIAAWRTSGYAVWLPLRDEDVNALEAKGLRMQVVVLTPECENYSIDETWRLLHESRAWREYVRDPERGLQEIFKSVDVDPKDIPHAKDYMKRLKRRYMISSTVSGFVPRAQDPLATDDIQVFLHPDTVNQR